MRRIAIDTNVYVASKVHDENVVKAFRNYDMIGIDNSLKLNYNWRFEVNREVAILFAG